MRFFSLEICQQLEKMGCFTHSNFFYVPSDNVPIYFTPATVLPPKYMFDDLIPAFIEQDFTGSSAQAKANAKIVFGEGYPNTSSWWGWEVHRYAMITSDDGIAYLTNYLKEKK